MLTNKQKEEEIKKVLNTSFYLKFSRNLLIELRHNIFNLN